MVSWGCAATSWLAKILNSHPDIYCVHAANLFWHVLGEIPRLDGVRYLQIIASQGHAHAAAGDVHGVSRHLIPELRATFGAAFNAAVVVREPAARLYSQMALFDQYVDLQSWEIGYIDEVIARCGVVLPGNEYVNRLFVHGVNMLNAVLEERECGRIFRAEDLTSDAEVLSQFIDEITRGKVRAEPEWVQAAVNSKRLNAHADAVSGRQLEDWQVDVVRKVVDPRAWEIYSELGYTTPEFASLRAGALLP